MGALIVRYMVLRLENLHKETDNPYAPAGQAGQTSCKEGSLSKQMSWAPTPEDGR